MIFAQVEALRSSLHELEGLLEGYNPLLSKSTERAVDKAIKYGAVFAEVGRPTSTYNEQEIDTLQLNIVAKTVFGVASVTFQVRARHWHIGGRSNA